MPEIITLNNGARLVYERLPHLRSVNLGFFVRCGSALEPDGSGGLSHFLEHMSFKGTGKRTTRQIAEDTDALGGGINAYTARQLTCYYGRCVDEDLRGCFDLLSDLVLSSAMPPDELERERGVVLEEIAMADDDPEDLCSELLTQTQYDHERQPIGRPILGTPEKIRACSRDELLAFRRSRYVPSGCVVSLCGAFDPAEARALAEEYLSSWQGPPAAQSAEPARVLDGQRAAAERDLEQIQLGLGYPGCAGDSPDKPALLVLNAILGDSMSSRLFQRIREELGLAYSVCSVPSCEQGSGLMQVFAGVSPANAQTALAEILRVIGALAADGPTEREFLYARRQLHIAHLLGQESAYGRMMSMGQQLLLRGAIRSPEEIDREISAVTLEEVADLARRIFAEHMPTLSAVGQGAEDIFLPKEALR